MTPDTEEQRRLARVIGAGLASQPSLKAPASLQARVLAQIARRAALPWWQRSLRHWPATVQLAFFATALLAGCLLLNPSVWSGVSQATAHLSAPIDGPLSWLRAVGGTCATLGSLMQRSTALILHQVAGFWLYGALGLLATMYLMLAGIGVTIYRNLDRA